MHIMKKIRLFICRGVHFILRHISYLDNNVVAKIDRLKKKIELEEKYSLENWKQIKFEEDNNWYSTQTLIAHACGGNVRLNYTNSKEALFQTCRDNFRVIEVDVRLSSDKKLICIHDFLNQTPYSHSQFLNKKIDKRFTPIDFDQCVRIIKKFKDIALIIDIKNRVEFNDIVNELSRFQKKYNIQMIIQIFYEEDLKKVDLFPVLYNLTYTDNYERVAAFCITNQIHVVSISTQQLKKSNAWNILIEHNIKIFAHTVNSLEEYQDLKRNKIAGVFTDFLIPEDLKHI